MADTDITSVLDELAAADLSTVDASVLLDDVVELRAQLDRLEAQWLRRIAAAQRVEAFRASGALSMAGVLRERCRFSHGHAGELVRTACQLRSLENTQRAFTAGEIGYRHAQLLTRAFSAPRRAAMAQAGLMPEEQEQILTEAARSLDPTRLRHLIDHWAHALDPEGALDAANAAHGRRRLHLSPMLDGVVALDGLLDHEGAEVVRTAVDALCGPPAPDDDRTPAQRRADALVEVARRSLDDGPLRDMAGHRPHVTVTVDLTTLQRRTGAAAGETAGGELVHGEAARRIACDAGIIRVLTAGASQPLDVGRATRSVSPALRAALHVRDGGCAHPACDRPSRHCDAHHIRHWADGGATSLDNLVLLCRRHHRWVHEGGWQVAAMRDGLPRWSPP